MHMKKKYILGAALVLGTLSLCTSCDNYFDEKYLDNGDPQHSLVKTYDYVLTDADYKIIADNKTNKAYAASLDEEKATGELNQSALALVGESRCFNDVASADMYVPAFIYSKYPHLDPGSTFNVTYRTDEGQPAYLDFYNRTPQYALTYADYKAVWGDLDHPYLTPSNEAQLTDFLPMVEDDYLVGVKYAFAQTEGERSWRKKCFMSLRRVSYGSLISPLRSPCCRLKLSHSRSSISPSLIPMPRRTTGMCS